MVLLEDIRDLFDRLCGKLLAPMLRLILDFLFAEYSLALEMRDLPASVSPHAIDHILKSVKTKGGCGADASGRTGERTLPNSTRRWVKEWTQQIWDELPFSSRALTAAMAAGSPTASSKTGTA
jgi:hypothetical protein